MPSRSREAAASTKKKHRPSPLLWLLLVLVVAVGGYRLFTGYFPFQPRQSLDGQTISSETLSQLRELAKDEKMCIRDRNCPAGTREGPLGDARRK